MQEAIKQDWENRDYIESISLNILKIAEFLNKFGMLLLLLLCSKYPWFRLTFSCNNIHVYRTKYKSKIGRIESKVDQFGEKDGICGSCCTLC